MRERKYQICLQLDANQVTSLEKILNARNDRASIAKIFREAFALYVQTNYPQFED